MPSVALLGLPLDAPVPLAASAPCALHLDFAAPIANLGGLTSPTWRINLPIPNDPSLIRRRVDAQAFYVTGSPRLASSSNGISLVLGN